MITILLGCKNTIEKNKVVLIHGTKNPNVVGKEVELSIDNYKDFTTLLNRVNEITCKDSIPTIEIDEPSVRHIFYIDLPCWDDDIIYDFSQKNVLIIRNDSIEKRFTNPWSVHKYPIEDIGKLLKKDLTNNGSDQNWSVSPEKHILSISVSEDRLDLFPTIFGELSEALENKEFESNVRIWLMDYVPFFEPPPPLDKK